MSRPSSQWMAQVALRGKLWKETIFKIMARRIDVSICNVTKGNQAVLSFLGPILFDKAGISTMDGSSDFWCPLVNISQCHLTETEANFNVLVYNPLSRYIYCQSSEECNSFT